MQKMFCPNLQLSYSFQPHELVETNLHRADGEENRGKDFRCLVAY